MAAPNPARVALLVTLITFSGHMNARAASPMPPADRHYYLPSPAASKVVTVTRQGEAAAEVIVLTQPVAIKETGPKETINAFGEVYAFSPTFIAAHRDEPTQITFWNLQPDADHDFALLAPDRSILMYVDLPPLKRLPTFSRFTKRVSSISSACNISRQWMANFSCCRRLRERPSMRQSEETPKG